MCGEGWVEGAIARYELEHQVEALGFRDSGRSKEWGEEFVGGCRAVISEEVGGVGSVEFEQEGTTV